MTIKAVLFDLDGVLLNACDWHKKALNKALLKTVGYSISEEDHYNKYNGLPTKVKLEMLGIRSELTKDIFDLKQKYTIELIEAQGKKDEDKIELVKYLQNENIVVACVTNSIRRTANLMLSKVGILDALNFVITNEDVRYPKPDNEGYIMAMIKSGSLPQETIIVEDSPKGIAAAQKSYTHIYRVDNADDVTLSKFLSYISTYKLDLTG